MKSTRRLPLPLAFALLLPFAGIAQEPQGGPPGGGFPGGGFPGGGFPGGGPGGPMGQEVKVLDQFDADQNHRLDAEERQAARAWLKDNRPQRGGRGMRGGPGGPGGFPGGPSGFGGPGGEGNRQVDPNAKGMTVRQDDVAKYPGRPLFDPDILRTVFVDLPNDDWFAELSDFYRTDVLVPATVTVDGTTYRDVGTGFRGNTSYMMAQGKKKSWNLDFGFVDGEQRLLGANHLDLLNCNDDPSFLREALHGWIANQFVPAQRVALVRLVVNGEDFGVYAAAQQFDKSFLEDHFGTKKGDRWKVGVDFAGNGGLRYLGDDPASYRRNYTLKSQENDAAWQGLADVCAALANAADEDLERILPQHLDVDSALWFLAIDNALGDDDGYFARASDYVLYRDPKGRFHPIARDNNEILKGEGGRGPGGGPGAGPGAGPGGGPGAGAGPGAGPGGMGGGPSGRRGGPGGIAKTPLAGASRQDRPLLHRLLAVPAWRERYLANLRAVATRGLAEPALAPRLTAWRTLLEPVVRTDVHALYGAAAFAQSFAIDDAGKPAPRSLLAIAAQRRQAILDDPALAGEWPELGTAEAALQRAADGSHTLHVRVQSQGAAVREVRLHHDRGAFGAYATAPMFDDGQHGDGAAGDGVFAADLGGIDAGGKVRFWCEAVAANSGHVACEPAGGGALPRRLEAPKAKQGEADGKGGKSGNADGKQRD